ncbi:unnamed protein product [Sphagnum troendelagicum]|uniref:Uncharacterized protein n=1 Tax=Sphagnum troendelagicum TaxID=128251 RepID=A0ABP0TU65_9BRYO
MFHHHRRPSEYVEVGEEYYPARERLGEDSTYVQEPGFYAASGGGVPPVPYTSTGAAAARPYNYGPESSVYGRPNVYAARPPPPAVVYESEPERSDLGMGARDSRIVESTDYGAGYGRPDLTTPYVAAAPGYVDGSTEAKIERLENQVERERRHKHEAEAVAAAAGAYGLYEHHEKHNAEEAAAAAAQSRLHGYPAAAATYADHEGRSKPHHHHHHRHHHAGIA